MPPGPWPGRCGRHLALQQTTILIFQGQQTDATKRLIEARQIIHHEDQGDGKGHRKVRWRA